MAIVIVELKKDFIAVVLDLSEVVLPVGVIILCEGVEGSDLGKDLVHTGFAKGLDTSRHHDPARAPSGPAEFIVQRCDLRSGGGLRVHGLISHVGMVIGFDQDRLGVMVGRIDSG